jgi:hypothetical protein
VGRGVDTGGSVGAGVSLMIPLVQVVSAKQPSPLGPENSFHLIDNALDDELL